MALGVKPKYVRQRSWPAWFARSFEKKVDTWVIHAVYEQLQLYLGSDVPVPIRATDRLTEELSGDREDLEMDLVAEIVQRTGRSLINIRANPYYDRVKTVGDLVMFFNAQPMDPAHSAKCSSEMT